MTNLKLQKLLYFEQGLSLVAIDDRLFDEEIVLRLCGPVVNSAYSRFKEYGLDPIPKPPHEFEFSSLAETHKTIIGKEHDVYGIYTASALERIASQGEPWIETKFDTVMDDEMIKKFFKKKIIVLFNGEGLFAKPTPKKKVPPKALRMKKKTNLTGD